MMGQSTQVRLWQSAPQSTRRKEAAPRIKPGATEGEFTPSPLLRQLDLLEVELDRGRAAEDRNRDLDPVLVEIELFDHAVEAGEGPVEDLDRIADLVIDRDV